MLAAPMNAATLHLSESPQVRLADHSTALALGSIDALLLAWLAVAGPTRRERLATLLWPDSPADSARTALRQRLFRLRRQCGIDLVAGNAVLGLAEGIGHDLHSSRTLLGSLELPSGTELAEWLSTERAQRRETERSALITRIETFERSGDSAAALPLAQALIALDPLREDAHRRLMRLLYLAGDRAAALRAFDECEQRLKHELGTRPSPETLDVLATIEAAEREALPAAAQRRTLPAALMRPPRLVGRVHELAQLQQLLALGGRGLLIGEAGLGKSRLLQALTGPASRSPSAPLMAAGRHGDVQVPYATLARALRALQAVHPQALAAVPAAQLAPLLPELAAATVLAKATRTSAAAAGTSAAAAAAGTSAAAPGASAAAPGISGATSHLEVPAALRQEALVAALAAVLREALQALGGIVLDDLHFADAATLQLLPELIAASGPGAWLLSMRPPDAVTPAAALLIDLAAGAPWETLTLAPLSDAALAEMVDSLALPGVSGERLAPLLQARSGGNPLFALETLKLAWTEGHLLAGGALPRPRNVGQLIDGALARLSPPALLLARVAAIAGVDFSVDLAGQVLQQAPLALAEPWAELESRQVLRGAAFAHDLMHDAVLAGIPEVLARHAHGQIAAWLEQHGGEPARLAAHWESAGQRERALPGLAMAAERAHAALREPERVAFLLRAADIAEAVGQPDLAFDSITAATEAHIRTLRDADGLPLLERLQRLARTPHQAATVAVYQAWYRTMLGHWDSAIEAGLQAVQCCAAMAEDELIAKLRATASQRLGTALAMAGRFDEALPYLRAAEPWVEAHAESDHSTEFHGNLAAVLDNLGWPAEAQPHHQRVVATTRALGDHSFLATALANLAVSRLNAGDVAGASGHLGQAQQLVSSFDLRGASTGFIAALQAQAARALGDYSAALHWCDQAEPLLASANPVWLPVVHMHRAQTLLDLGQPARAQQALARCEPDTLAPRQRARHAMLTGRLRLLLQQDASREFDAALAAAPEPGWPELRLTVRIERAQALPSPAACDELRAVLQQGQALGLQGVALAALLRLAQRSSDPAEALQAARQALATAPEIEPNGLYRAERWLAPAQALLAAAELPGVDSATAMPANGLAAAQQIAEAQALAAQGWAWAQACAAQLPEPMRDAYLHRQPVNQALQALVTRR